MQTNKHVDTVRVVNPDGKTTNIVASAIEDSDSIYLVKRPRTEKACDRQWSLGQRPAFAVGRRSIMPNGASRTVNGRRPHRGFGPLCCLATMHPRTAPRP